MNLPFLRFFKRDKSATGASAAVATAPIVPIAKPASERFGKTVLPNTSRIVGLEPARTFPVPAPGGVAAVVSAAPAASAASGPRKISFGGNDRGTATLPPELPNTPGQDRTIALQLLDLVPHIPGGMLAPAQIDPERRVLLKASELERGMANGRPTVLLRAIYQQAPEFFTGEVDPADQTEVPLPFGKVLEQFAALQTRPDQVCEEAVPEVETPFLKATLEDSKRFGTSVAPLPKPAPLPLPETAAVAPVAPPKADLKPIKPIRLSIPEGENTTTQPVPAPIRLDAPPARPPIIPKVSPNGTGVPATERVPASSGPSVPTPLPSPLAPPPPTRIPFKVSPPSNDLREAFAPKLPTLKPRVSAEDSPPHGPRVRLPLRSVLRGIPPFQLSGPIDEVPEAAVIEFAFSIVEPQLSLGRISVSPAQFQAALPEEFHARFKLEDPETPIALPLQEVLQNLPNESLQLRGDQEEVEIAEVFETPFSKKAAEDAARFKVAAAPIAKATLPTDLATGTADPGFVIDDSARQPAQEVAAKTASKPPGTPLPAATKKPDPKSIVAQAGDLPGVRACAVVFSDGLSLAGNLPAEYKLDALCAIAPSIMKRVGDQIAGANLGSLEGLTLFCAKTPVSFFAQGDICLAALHAEGELGAATRVRLNSIAQELARIYAQPA